METNEGRGLDFRPPGGESPREVLARVRPWMEELAEQDVPTLAICHRGVMRVVFASAMRWDMTGKAPAKLDWTALQVFELTVGAGVQVVALNAPLQRAHVSPPDAPVAPTGGSS